MIVGLYVNKRFLSEKRCYLDKTIDALNKRCVKWKTVNSATELDGLSVLMVFGGDGTILTVASECARRGIKIIGINYGHIGFLAEFEPDKLDCAIELISTGNFLTDKRSMLKIEYADKIFYALNDVVIQRSTCGSAFSNTINLSADIDGSVVDNYSADGLIVSTPTGSTAYSLAAGGSVLTPDINAFILTPVCAHSLHSRPIVYNDQSILTIRPNGSRGMLNIIVDGVAVEALEDNTSVTVSKADYYVEFITTKDKNFFNKLLIKLNIWSK